MNKLKSYLILVLLWCLAISQSFANTCVPDVLARVTTISAETWSKECKTTSTGTDIPDLKTAWSKIMPNTPLTLHYSPTIDETATKDVLESAIGKFILLLQSNFKPSASDTLVVGKQMIWMGNYIRHGNSGLHCALITFMGEDRWVMSHAQLTKDGKFFEEDFNTGELLLHTFGILEF